MSKVQSYPEKDSTTELEELSAEIELRESCLLEDSKLMHATDSMHLTTEKTSSDSERDSF